MDIFQVASDDRLMNTSYSPMLVLLSVLIAMFSSIIALQIVSVSIRRPLQPRYRQLSLAIGAIGLGAGTWSMHFIGMLAFEMDTPISYRVGLTFLSMIPAILASWVALNVIARREVYGWRLLIGGTMVGVGIGLMHYGGMAAMVTSATLRYEAPVFLLSIVVAVALSILALWIRFRLDRRGGTPLSGLQRDILAGMVMGMAISAMHYTGMAAARFIPPDEVMSGSAESGQRLLLVTGVTVATLVIIALVVMGNLLVRYRSALEQRRIVEARLLENEARFRSLISNIPGAAYRCLPNERWDMIYISDAVEEICGWPAADFMMPHATRSWVDVVYQDDRRLVEHHEAETSRFQIEYRIRHRNGSTRWVLETGDYICDAGGQPEWLDGFIMDITGRKSMEVALREARDRAEQAAEARATFLANMSHEIRTPMNAIIGFTDILLEQHVEEQDRRRYLESISRSSRSLLHLLNDVLDSARLDKGRLSIEQRPFSLSGVLDTVISTLWLQARDKGLVLNLSVSPSLQEHYLGAEERIRQVLMNLLGNAIKFTEKGHVSLVVDQGADDRQVVFRVSDTGIGMDEQQLATIFEPFTQADASVSRRFGGTGLGTTISKQLVEMMGGEISAQSRPGQGSCFMFSLPLEPTSPPQPERPELEISLPPLRILAADDLQQNLDLLTAMLCRDGHTVDCVGNGREAVDKAVAGSYDVILMDIQMPELDGLSATRQLHRGQDERGVGRTPVVALTASVLVADRDAAHEAGMSGFAGKPVERAALVREMARVLGMQLAEPERCDAVDDEEARQPGMSLDLEKGAELWGSVSLYRSELQRFAAEQAAIPDQIAYHLRESDLAAVRPLAHILKGISGNLALTALYRTASSLESAARAGDHTGSAVQFEQLQQAWQAFIAVVAQQDSFAVSGHSVRTETASGVVEAAIGALREAAAVNEHDDAALSDLRQMVGEIHSDVVDRIVHASEDFDFERLVGELARLEERLRG